METAESTLYIFHLRRKDRKALILHPFGKEQFIVGQARMVRGLYGADPQLDVVNEFREFMYRQLDLELRGWLSEHRFIPRFLISALVFLVAYFVLNFVIRDPIPFLVQSAGAVTAAILTYGAIGRRDALSSIAVERRAIGRTLINEVNFDYSPVLEAIEDLVEHFIDAPDLDVAVLVRDMRQICDAQMGSAETQAEVEILRKVLPEMIRERYGNDVTAKLEHRFGNRESPEEMPFEALVQWAKSYKADAGLLAMYLGLH